MAQTIDAEKALMTRLSAAVDDAGNMLHTLLPLMAEPDVRGPSAGNTSGAPASSAPWNEPVAAAYLAIWHGARALALDMAGSIDLLRSEGEPTGWPGLKRVLALSPSVPPFMLRTAVRRVEAWCDRARELPAIDQAEAWVPVPAVPGTMPPTCPYCKTFGLRMQRRRAVVRCVFPGCTDADGRPTRARMEPGRMTGEARLSFDDGTALHFRGMGD